MGRLDLFTKGKGRLDKYGIPTSPAIQLVEIADETIFSKIGSVPEVPVKEFEWPTHNGRSLAFLMQLKFSELNGNGQLPLFPREGLLYVFYDQNQATWGFDQKDRGSWRLLYFAETDALKGVRYPKDIEVRHLPQSRLTPRHITTYPPSDFDMGMDQEFAANLSEEEENLYGEMAFSVYGDMPSHQLGGYPLAVQDPNMDLECALVTNGCYCGDETGYEYADKFAAEREAWMLFLQIDSCGTFMWGDGGTLYFWIKKDDLTQKNFADAWMILQCS